MPTPSGLVVGIFTSWDRLKLTTLVDIDELKIVGSLSLILGVATDVFTSAALCFFLRGLRTGYSK